MKDATLKSQVVNIIKDYNKMKAELADMMKNGGDIIKQAQELAVKKAKEKADADKLAFGESMKTMNAKGNEIA